MTFYFGAHVSIANGMVNAAEEIYMAGGNLLQIFLTSPRQRKVSKKSEPERMAFVKYTRDHDIKVVVHSSYLVNIAKNWDEHSWWLKNLELEIEYADKIGAFGLVIHFGKQLELTNIEAYNNMYTSIIHILNKTSKHKNVQLLLETTSGQGTEMCYKLEDLAYFYNKFKKLNNKEIINRVRLCVDTCHIFAAGYNIATKDDVKKYLKSFEKLIGLKYISLVHLNDSKCALGCRKDRHQNIGEGQINKLGLIHFYKYFKKLNIPIVLETPNKGYLTEIKMLKKY